MSVAQAASVAARLKAEFAGLDFSRRGIGASDAEAITCSYVVRTAQQQGLIATRELKAIQPPPAEVAALIQDTMTATATLGANDVSACDADPLDLPGCAGPAVRVEHYVKQFERALAAWEPYV